MTTFAVWKTNAKCGQLLQLPDELDYCLWTVHGINLVRP